ncbi:MAG TPA: BatA domain-containing protein [Chryseosolibacter sp.]
MIAFSNPLWLYGLFGLLVPIGIHLLSRKEGKTIYIGSIRHLTDSDTAQFSSIRLNEILLLVLRLIVITLVVLLLAGFRLTFNNEETKQWLVIEKGVEKNQEYKAFIDRVASAGFEIHWLSENFPAYQDSTHAVAPQNYYKLADALGTTVDTAIVLSHNLAQGFKGETMSLPPNIQWLVVDPSEKELVIDAITKGDSIQTRIASSASKGTSLSYSIVAASQWQKLKKIDSLSPRNVDTITVTIYATPEFDYDKKIIQAVLQALAQQTGQVINIEVTSDSTSISSSEDIVFWLSTKRYNGQHPNVIGQSECTLQNIPLLIPRDEVRSYCNKSAFAWMITKRLNEENVLSESLTVSLARILFHKHPLYAKTNFGNYDQRSMPAEAVFNPAETSNGRTNDTEVKAGTEPTLYFLLFFLLIAERLLAFKRNQ